VLGGVRELWDSGLPAIAGVVFLASFTVPLLKVLALAWILRLHGTDRDRALRDRIHRIVHTIGNWSMIDIFLLSVLSAVGQLGALGSVTAEPGAIYFCAVMICCLVAAEIYKPRLIWESPGREPMNEPAIHPHDHGVTSPRRRTALSWVWLFPVMAALAAGAMFYRNWSQEGPTIYVQFSSAPGMKPEKTLLYYRGVEAGTVTGIQLGKNLDSVLVKVRLRKHAEELARQGTLFWIDQPVFNLAKPSGIQSLIDGNSLQARRGNGPPAYFFVGIDEVPVAPLEGEPLFIKLYAENIPVVETGSEVSYRGLSVGLVRSKGIDVTGRPYVEIGFAKNYIDIVRSNARFWSVVPWELSVGAGVFQINVPSLKNFLLGGIAMDYAGPDRGAPVSSGSSFPVHPSRESAMASSDPVTLEFRNGQGLVPGMTQLRYLGLPVGIVETAVPVNGKVLVTARFREGYDFLRSSGSVFSIIRPVVEIPKVGGLETWSAASTSIASRDRGQDRQQFQGSQPGRGRFHQLRAGRV